MLIARCSGRPALCGLLLVSLMRKLTIRLTVLAVVLYCLGATKAQSRSDEVVANIKQAMKEMEPEWHCLTVNTPQGEPGPDSPRGTKYQFSCQQKKVALTIFMFFGEWNQDAEKALALSQRLQINESRRVEGIGEQAYELAKERFAWITFHKASVVVQVNAAAHASETDGPSETEAVRGSSLIEGARLFARLVARHVPAA